MDTKTLKAMADRLQELADGAEPNCSLSRVVENVASTAFGIRPEIMLRYPETSAKELAGDFTSVMALPSNLPQIIEDYWLGENGAKIRSACRFFSQKIRKEIGDEAN